MSHSPHGECDVEPERTSETQGPEQPVGRADDRGPGSRVDGSERTPHQAHPGGIPEGGCRRPGSRPSWSPAAQRNTGGNQSRGITPGQHPLLRNQPHPSERIAWRARGYRHRPQYAATHTGFRRVEQPAPSPSAQLPGWQRETAEAFARAMDSEASGCRRRGC